MAVGDALRVHDDCLLAMGQWDGTGGPLDSLWVVFIGGLPIEGLGFRWVWVHFGPRCGLFWLFN